MRTADENFPEHSDRYICVLQSLSAQEMRLLLQCSHTILYRWTRRAIWVVSRYRRCSSLTKKVSRECHSISLLIESKFFTAITIYPRSSYAVACYPLTAELYGNIRISNSLLPCEIHCLSWYFFAIRRAGEA